MGSGDLNQVYHRVLDWWQLLSPTTALCFWRSPLAPTCWLAASCPASLLGASTVGIEGVEESIAGGGAACLATLGFLATPVCRLAACPPGQRLLGKGEEVGAFTVGREGGEEITAGAGPLPPPQSPQPPWCACLAPAE